MTEVYDAGARAIRTAEGGGSVQRARPSRPAASRCGLGQETVEGRTYYMIAGADPNPITEAHYTFADGYLIAGPTRALIAKALQTKTAGTSITHSANFLAMEPRDHYANYSAVVYENLGRTLAPLVGMFGSFDPSAGARRSWRTGRAGRARQYEAHAARRLCRGRPDHDRGQRQYAGERHVEPARRESVGSRRRSAARRPDAAGAVDGAAWYDCNEIGSMRFTAVYVRVPEGYIGFVEELPGANTQGETLEQTRTNLVEAVTMVLQANRELSP